MSKIFINTLAFQQKLPPPIKQQELFPDLLRAGLRNIEIRREYIVDFDAEIPAIAKTASENDVTLYYSIPAPLFDSGAIDQVKIGGFFQEAKALGSKTVKLAVGDYNGIGPADEDFLRGLSSTGIQLLVENDQTAGNGTVAKILKFLDEAEQRGLDIKFTFDIGNWIWAGEDPTENARLLKRHVGYVHFKDVTRNGDALVPVRLGEGTLAWDYFKDFFAGLPFGIEYPCGENAIEVLQEEYIKLA